YWGGMFALIFACGDMPVQRPAAADRSLRSRWLRPYRTQLSAQYPAPLAASGRAEPRCADPAGEFERWIADDASACGIRAVETFAAGHAQNGDAVHATLTLPWSNAQAFPHCRTRRE